MRYARYTCRSISEAAELARALQGLAAGEPRVSIRFGLQSVFVWIPVPPAGSQSTTSVA